MTGLCEVLMSYIMVEAVPMAVLFDFSYHRGGSSHNFSLQPFNHGGGVSHYCSMWLLNSRWRQFPMTVLSDLSYHGGGSHDCSRMA